MSCYVTCTACSFLSGAERNQRQGYDLTVFFVYLSTTHYANSLAGVTVKVKVKVNVRGLDQAWVGKHSLISTAHRRFSELYRGDFMF